MSALNQIGAVTAMNLRSVPQRFGSSLVIVIGMASVVAVLISVLSMSTGFMDSVNKTGSPERVVVTSSGAVNETNSTLSRDNIPTIIDAPGVKKDADGKPIASAEFYTDLPLVKKSDGYLGQVPLHGTGQQIAALIPEIKLVSGRMYKPAVHELIVGKLVQTQFDGLQVGDKIVLSDSDWTIVGSFESNGDERESELIGDAETILSAFRRTNFNSVTARLESAEAYDTFKTAMTTNPSLSVDVMRESDYYAKLSKPLNDLLTLVAYWVGGIMAVGAVFGALNTMYSAVSARSREIATLRAIGFGAGPVVASVFAEALLLTLVGAIIGAGLAWLFFNGNIVVSAWAVYALAVPPSLLALGIGLGAAIGMLGGLFPAIRAARLPIATALRAT